MSDAREPPAPAAYLPPPDSGLDCLHADDALLVLAKPAGLLSAPGRGAGKADCLVARAQARFPGALLVHRLDMDTSGLIVLARDARTHARLSEAFRERRVAKGYEALVHGGPPGDAGEIDLPLAADWPRRPRQIVSHESGKPSLTRWRVLARHGATARLALEPVTGRSHQLRVHLADSGWPIVGDPLYGRAGDDAPRLMLHACRIAFAHPVDGRPLDFTRAAPF